MCKAALYTTHFTLRPTHFVLRTAAQHYAQLKNGTMAGLTSPREDKSENGRADREMLTFYPSFHTITLPGAVTQIAKSKRAYPYRVGARAK